MVPIYFGGYPVTRAASALCKRAVLVEPPLIKHDVFDLYCNKSQPLGLWSIGTFLKRRGIEVYLLDGGLNSLGRLSLLNKSPHGTLRRAREAWIDGAEGLLSGRDAVSMLRLEKYMERRTWVGMDLGILVEKIVSLCPTVIGLSCMATVYRETVALLSRRLKELLPQVPVVCGGQDATSEPEALLRVAGGGIDYIVLGEGEEALVEFIVGGMTPEAAMSAGFAFLASNQYIPGRPRTFAKWGEAPPFDPSLMAPNNYPESPGHAWQSKGKWTDILFSKGCTFNCKFCYSGRLSLRTLPLRVVDQQLRQLRAAGYKELIIQDDAFGQPINGSRDYWFQVMELLEKHHFAWQNNNGFTWEYVNRELVTRVKHSGCTAAFMPINFRGFGRPEIDEVRAARIRETYRTFRDAGLVIHGGGIFGVPALDCPDETLELAWEFVDFQRALVREGLVDAVVVYALSALPGTEWRRGIEEGWLAGKDFRRVKIHGDNGSFVGFSNHTPQVVVDGAVSYEKLCELIWDAQIEINGVNKAREWFVEGRWVSDEVLPPRALAAGGVGAR